MWVLEYSKSQNCFHIDKLSRVIITNRKSFETNRWNDYRIIGVYDSSEIAHDEVSKLRRII